MDERAALLAVEEALVIANAHGRVAPIDSVLRTELARGNIVKLRRGLYARRALWSTFSSTQRYQALVIGVARSDRALPVLSHASAAALHGLPRTEAWPQEVHELAERLGGGRSKPGRRRHAVGIDGVDVIQRDGLLMTSIERTVVDLAATSTAFSAVAAIDAALHVDRWRSAPPATSTSALLNTWERMLPFRGSVRARALIEFGDGGAGSPIESISRVTMARLGLPAPELQRTWRVDGAEYDTDFYFPDADAIGEVDGKGKYLDPMLRAWRTAEEVVYEEKRREDALRRRVRAFTRWDDAVSRSMPLLAARLAEVGVLPVQAPRFREPRFREPRFPEPGFPEPGFGER